MRVAVVAPRSEPPTVGGAERAWTGLVGALAAAGHEAELVTRPVAEGSFAEVAAGYRTFAALDLSGHDLVISSKYPAWMAPHPRHVLWMFHPLRGLYDTYHLFRAPMDPGPVADPTRALLDLVAGPARRDRVTEVLDAVDAAVAELGADHDDLRLPGPTSRLVVHWLDRVALAPGAIARHTALSRTIAVRADYLPPGVGAHVAHAPSDVPASHPLPGAPAGDAERPRTHLFTTSRLDGPKRIDLVIRAMAHVPGEVPLLVAGTGPDEERLRALAAEDPRIRFLGRVTDEELGRLYAEAIAVPFVPYDEDYGLITVEAMAAGAPVVTVADSGGPTEVIRDGVDGLITDATPEALGAALAGLVADRARAREVGEAARRRAARISWPAAVRTILGDLADDAPPPAPDRRPGPGTGRRSAGPGGRPKVVVLTTFRVADRGHGGQLRSFHLYGALGRHADVEIVSLTDGGDAGSTELAPGLVETAVPVSDAQRAAAEEMSLAVGIPVSDLAAGSEIELTPAYLRALRTAARTADVVILAEPYLHPALAAAGVDLPFVYDAFNVEADLKGDVLPPTRAGRAVLDRVTALEARVCAEAAAITACSRADAHALAAAGGRSSRVATVVPNGTDVRAHPMPDPETRRRRGARWLERYRALDPRPSRLEAIAVFFGSWHPPNLDAAEAVLWAAPAVPEVLFVLGGRHGDAFEGRRLPGNVVFTGVVPTSAKDALLSAAHVALNPVRLGSGTNLKIIEYLAAGIPVASSTFGVRGLEVANGVHAVIGDDVRTAVQSVLADPEAADERARAGRALVEEAYDWSTLGERLWAVVADVIGTARGPSAPARRG
ncbi:glycosyltransferase family 4 protein [Iamia sp. SCSIO 61187]|uniref:glycosyltransferase family 4 protein n=1 Tax=Iamia sp. SCSIO 61187 TaxID=2722752 RepID=UPI001C62C416|nr:glycosyltransferase family 4 protein [Iamia sp. SCSIO 61187]QYG93824.1 glycosyltransferase family 4 protein [Iamia sp. SCSIO 61187]